MSLGWLSESAFLPRKARRIEGVTTNTLVNLKAALYDSQAKKTRTAPRTERSTIGGKNQGVEQRIQRDLNTLRSEQRDSSRVALEKKAEIYYKMIRGELDNDDDVLIDHNTIDFQHQRFVHAQHDQQQASSLLDNQKIQAATSDAKQTATAREHVKRIRKQQKTKQLKRIAKIKQKANMD